MFSHGKTFVFIFPLCSKNRLIWESYLLYSEGLKENLEFAERTRRYKTFINIMNIFGATRVEVPQQTYV